jgi:hypothetical protein
VRLSRKPLARHHRQGLARSLQRVKAPKDLKRPMPLKGTLEASLGADQALAEAAAPTAEQVETTAVELAVLELSLVLRSRRNGCWLPGVGDKRGFRSRQAPQPTRRV